MPIFAPLLRPFEGFDVDVFVLELKVLVDGEVELGVEVSVAVGVGADSDEVDVVDDSPTVARSVTPSLRSQHVTLTLP